LYYAPPKGTLGGLSGYSSSYFKVISTTFTLTNPIDPTYIFICGTTYNASGTPPGSLRWNPGYITIPYPTTNNTSNTYNSVTGACSWLTSGAGGASNDTMVANAAISGGGTISFTGSGFVTWTSTITIAPINATFGSFGYFTISSNTACVLLNQGQALYYIPTGATGPPYNITDISAFKSTITNASNMSSISTGWILLCSRDSNPTNPTLKWAPGNTVISLSGTFNQPEAANSSMQKMAFGYTITGGGAASWNVASSGRIAWTSSIYVNAVNPEFGTQGYFTISANSGGTALSAGSVLYVLAPKGTSSSGISTYSVASSSIAANLPLDAIIIAAVDQNSPYALRWNPGSIIIPSGQTFTYTSGATTWGGGVGAQGDTGATGFTGAAGVASNTGATGYTGYSGRTGYTGFTGIAGSATNTGATGFTGFTGATGFTGFTGIAGTASNTGATGATGFTGFTGATGIAGLASNTGATGFTGFTGATGIAGLASNTGATGITGFTGLTGAIG